MEKEGFISRNRSAVDERKVLVHLSLKGQELKNKAASIPEKLTQKLADSDLKVEDLIKLKKSLDAVIAFLQK